MIRRSVGLSIMHKVFMLLAAALLCSFFVTVVAEASAVYSNEKIINDIASMQGLQVDVEYPEFDYFDEEYYINAADGAVIDLYIDLEEQNPMMRSLSSMIIPVYLPANSSGIFTLNLYGGSNSSSLLDLDALGNVCTALFESSGSLSVSGLSTYFDIPTKPTGLQYDLSIDGRHAVIAGGNGVQITYYMYFPCISRHVDYSAVVSGSFEIAYKNTSSYSTTANLNVSSYAPTVSFSNTGTSLASLYDDTTYEKLMYEFWTTNNFLIPYYNASGLFSYYPSNFIDALYNLLTISLSMQNSVVNNLPYINSNIANLYGFLSGNGWLIRAYNGDLNANTSLYNVLFTLTENQYGLYKSIFNDKLFGFYNGKDFTGYVSSSFPDAIKRMNGILFNINAAIDNLTNGYSNEVLASGSEGFGSTLTGFNDSLGVIVNGVESDLSDPSTINHVFEFTAGLNSALQFVGSFETVFLVNSGDFTTVIPLLYSLVFLSILVGLWRFFKR